MVAEVNVHQHHAVHRSTACRVAAGLRLSLIRKVSSGFHGRLERLGDVWPPVRIGLYHPAHQRAQVLRVVVGQLCELPARDLLEQRVQVVLVALALEGGAERGQFVQQAAQRPDVGLPLVAPAVEHLGRH
eukprot:scaffold10868_cov121-Isochrysis_galbana.AAC.10